MATERPTRLTPEMALAAARKTAAELVSEGHLPAHELEEAVRDIAKHGRLHGDGYDLAKDLDRYSYWDCDLHMAETLDSFSHYAQQEIHAAQKAWAEANNITPPLLSGTRVTLGNGETGEITGVYEYGVAQFLVKIDGDEQAEKTQRRRIVNFEDVLPIVERVE